MLNLVRHRLREFINQLVRNITQLVKKFIPCQQSYNNQMYQTLRAYQAHHLNINFAI